MSDPFRESADLRANLNQDRLDFLRTDLTTCFTFAVMAETEFQIGDLEAGQRSLADGEKGHAMISRFLSDPKHATHLTAPQIAELTEGLRALRQRLDDLHGLHPAG
jgi:hypothetical protein